MGVPVKASIDKLAFILGMKKNKYPQVLGRLFFVEDDGDLCGCALGQGLLETVANPDDIRARIVAEGSPSRRTVIGLDGKRVEKKGKVHMGLENEWQSFVARELGTVFTSNVMSANDSKQEPVPSIAARFRDMLGV